MAKHNPDWSIGYGGTPTKEQIALWETVKSKVSYIGGRLYISGYPDEDVQQQMRDFGIKQLISLTQVDPPAIDGVEITRYPMKDSVEVDKEQVRAAAEHVGRLVFRDEKVLVHCAYGLNRSALVAAQHIANVIGQPYFDWEGPEIIRLIRAKRKGALHNPYFVEWINNGFV